MAEKKTTLLSVRVTSTMRKEFNAKAKRFGDPSDIHRQLIDAFNEDRLTIQPPLNTESLYNVPRKED